MRRALLFIFMVLTIYGLSQSVPETNQKTVYKPTDPKFVSVQDSVFFKSQTELLKYAEKNYLNSEIQFQELRLVSQKKSPAGSHTLLRHYYQNYPVFQSTLMLTLSKEGQLVLVTHHLVPFEKPVLYESFPENCTEWMSSSAGLIPVYREVEQSTRKVITYKSTGGETLLRYHPRLYLQNPDTQIKAMVFMPNPIVKSNAKYGGGYKDNNDADSPELTASRSKVQVLVNYKNGKFILGDGLITLKDIHNPAGNPIQPTDTFLNYTRSHDGFEDVNVYYHIKSFSDYLRLKGFEGLLDSIHVDPHGANGDDNSFLDPSTYPLELEIGTGNVDDGEDAQVVLHEFGHGLSVVASPGTTSGNQRLAMEEGQADYAAMSYSWSLSKNKSCEVFSWDGHNEFWSGFSICTNRMYKDLTGIKDLDREVWSTPLKCIYDKLGRARADSLIYSSYFMQAADSKMPQMARVILKLDSMMYGGKEVGKIWQCFTDRGILDTVPKKLDKLDLLESEKEIKILNSYEFAKNMNPLVILVFNPNRWGDLKMYNSLGQLVMVSAIENRMELSPIAFKPGQYYLVFTSKNYSETVTKKLMKF